MIVVTTPTGQIGSALLRLLADHPEPIRVIVRDPTRLDPETGERVSAITGSHNDPAVLDRALEGADALFWVIPPDFSAPSAVQHYVDFTRPAAAAVRRHGVGHVVSVSSAGHNWPKPAGMLSAAFAADAVLAETGVAFRALSAGSFMENLLRDLGTLRDQGSFALAADHDRPLGTIAVRDIATTAAGLLSDRSWEGQANLPLFSPGDLTPDQMADVISEVLGKPVSYRQLSLDQVEAGMLAAGASQGTANDMVAMFRAHNEGVYDADRATATPTATSFKSWCEEVLRPALAL
jgi:uncharacterized protein YbjT (DUF2867 family)